MSHVYIYTYVRMKEYVGVHMHVSFVLYVL